MGQAIIAFGQRRERQSSLIPQIDESRRRGYSVSSADGVTAIAVPVFGADGQVRASIGVQARSARLNTGLIGRIQPLMRHTAALLSDVAESGFTGTEHVLPATI